jgi:hypothetical protein
VALVARGLWRGLQDVKVMQQLKEEDLKEAFDALVDEEGTIDSRQVCRRKKQACVPDLCLQLSRVAPCACCDPR